jgi:hypothetical protein
MGGSQTLEELTSLMPCPQVHQMWQTYVENNLPRYLAFLPTIPIPQGHGSISLSESFWLFQLVTELRPTTIVESGTATGWSTFVMAGAAPDAKIFCFDPYNRPAALPITATHSSRDWSSHKSWPVDTFAFFDDHCNQRKRLQQAQHAGLQNAVFHDVYRVRNRSLLSLVYLDVVGLAESLHTFDPIWAANAVFVDTTRNPQMYRWLTWVRVAEKEKGIWPCAKRCICRRMTRNPWASRASSMNWTSA